MPRKIISLFLCFVFIFTQAGFAQTAVELNLAANLAGLHQNLFAQTFRPIHLRYFSYDNSNNQFKVFLDKGDTKDIKYAQLKENTQELLNYFLIGVTLPDSAFWVNLRPDAEDNILDPKLERTDIGKVLLEADLQLKKDTANFTSPQTPEGKAYWDKLYKKAEELFGYDNITIPTLTRPWIVPGEIIIRETKDSAYIYKATLKVMLEQDHLKNSATYNFADPRLKALNEYSSQIIRETIIPKLTKEVNNSKRYANLRQVYYSLVLARWFKARFNGQTGAYAQLINRSNLTNLTSKDSWSKTTYFNDYQKSFKNGEYNIKQPVSTPYGQSIRSYFSGGIALGAELNLPGTTRGSSPAGVFRGNSPRVLDTLTSNMPGFAGTPDGALQKTGITSSPANLSKMTAFQLAQNFLEDDAHAGYLYEASVGTLENARIALREDIAKWLKSKGLDSGRVTADDIFFCFNISVSTSQADKKSLMLDIIDRKPASSPVVVDQAAIETVTQKLATDRLEERLQTLFGKTTEEIERMDPELAKIVVDYTEKGPEKNRLGWSVAKVKWLLENPNEVKKVIAEAEQIRDDGFENVIIGGMGGSGLAVQTVKTTFATGKGLNIYSLRTTDPAVIADILQEISLKRGISLPEALKKTKIVVISKSATTRETNTHKDYFEGLCKALNLHGANIDLAKNINIITDEGSPWTKEGKGYGRSDIQLNGRGDIGGRFTSPTTRIFLLPLALSIDRVSAENRTFKILKRALEMNDVDINKDVFFKLAAFLFLNATNSTKIRDKVTLLMPEELRELPLWAEQLFEESLGKEGKGVTLFYGENLSPEALQPVLTNDRVFLRINLKGKKTNTKLWDNLTQNGYPVFEINVEDVDDIGGLMLGLQRTVAAIGYLWKIGFVDQPAVNGYKNGTNEVMNRFQAESQGKGRIEVSSDWRSADFKNLKLYYEPLIKIGAVNEEELRAELVKLWTDLKNAPAVYAAILNILSKKPGFEITELTSYGRMTPGLRSILQNHRSNIFTRGLKMPTKLGEGPDKNHSYQQNIEDGRNMFFSTYFMPLRIQQPSEVFPDVAPDIAKALVYDDNLLRAQTIGTVESMIKNGRKVVLITANTTTLDAEKEVDVFFTQVDGYLKQLGTYEKAASSPVSVSINRIADDVKKINSELMGVGVSTGLISRLMIASVDKTMLLNDFAESAGIDKEQALQNMFAAGIAIDKGNGDYELTKDFFDSAKLDNFVEKQVTSSSNPRMADLTSLRIERIIFNAVNPDNFIKQLAINFGISSDDPAMVAGFLQKNGIFPIISAAWQLDNAVKATATSSRPLKAEDVANTGSAAGYYKKNGVDVNFSLPSAATVDAKLFEAFINYLRVMEADMARGGYNYRSGKDTKQSVDEFFREYFMETWYKPIQQFVIDNFNGGKLLKVIVTNGIGANDQFMWALARMYNENRPEGAPIWIHVAMARDLAKLAELKRKGIINEENVLFIDISRSGGTWEGVEVAIRSLGEGLGFKKHIAVANGGAVEAIARTAASLRSYNNPLIIGMSPDIGGRNMHRKTTIYYTALTVAGMFLPTMDSTKIAVLNDKFDKANDFATPEESLAVSAGQFLFGAMRLFGAEHIAFMTNTEPLRLVATEWEQYIMEGSNKTDVISMGIHDLSKEPAYVLRNFAEGPAAKMSVGMAILDKSAPTYDSDLERAKALEEKMPLMIFTINSKKAEAEGGLKGGISPTQQAAFDILWTDMVTVFTTLLRVDANSNPNVKLVRKYTGDRVATWRNAAAIYAEDDLGREVAKVLVSYGTPGYLGGKKIGSEGVQIALTRGNAKAMGQQFAQDLAKDKAFLGRNRLNLFVGRDDLMNLVSELRNDTYKDSNLVTKFGWMPQTALFPLWSHKGLEANLAHSTDSEKPLLANKTVEVFFNARSLGEGGIFNQQFDNQGIMNAKYAGINGATIHQTNDAMTIPNIKRMAEVSPTILFEFNDMDSEVEDVIKAFYGSFISEMSGQLEKAASSPVEMRQLAVKAIKSVIAQGGYLKAQKLIKQNLGYLTPNDIIAFMSEFIKADEYGKVSDIVDELMSRGVADGEAAVISFVIPKLNKAGEYAVAEALVIRALNVAKGLGSNSLFSSQEMEKIIDSFSGKGEHEIALRISTEALELGMIQNTTASSPAGYHDEQALLNEVQNINHWRASELREALSRGDRSTVERVASEIHRLDYSELSQNGRNTASRLRGSSPAKTDDVSQGPGGIDFRQMAITCQPMGSFTNLNFNLPKVANLDSFNLEVELGQIKAMVSAGIIPSAERIKEYVAACYAKGELKEQADELVACLAQVCKLEEAQAAESKPELKEVLVILDAV